MEAAPPHEALFLVISYLPLYELLSTSQVCRSLRDAINTDVLPWRNLVVDKPLNLRLSDETLVKFSSRAKGKLSSLSLISCPKVTDSGLLSVVASNPLISKLHVPGCTGLTPEGLLKAIDMLTKGGNSITSLRINGIYNIKQHHLKEILSHLLQQNIKTPSYKKYYIDSSTSSHLNDGNLSIDVEICPICNEVKMVYDCPRETCSKKSAGECRACSRCIRRCIECGVCFANDADEEQQGEAVCQDVLCLDCWLKLPKCNFCNKPYCHKHAADKKSPPSGSTGFVCDACYFNHSHSL